MPSSSIVILATIALGSVATTAFPINTFPPAPAVAHSSPIHINKLGPNALTLSPISAVSNFWNWADDGPERNLKGDSTARFLETRDLGSLLARAPPARSQKPAVVFPRPTRGRVKAQTTSSPLAQHIIKNDRFKPLRSVASYMDFWERSTVTKPQGPVDIKLFGTTAIQNYESQPKVTGKKPSSPRRTFRSSRFNDKKGKDTGINGVNNYGNVGDESAGDVENRAMEELEIR